jgi:hypothetical protein
MSSGGGESEESGDVLEIFFAMIRVIRGLLMFVVEVIEVAEEVRSGM